MTIVNVGHFLSTSLFAFVPIPHRRECALILISSRKRNDLWFSPPTVLPYYASSRKIFTHGIMNFVTIDYFHKIIILGGNVGEAANWGKHGKDQPLRNKRRGKQFKVFVRKVKELLASLRLQFTPLKYFQNYENFMLNWDQEKMIYTQRIPFELLSLPPTFPQSYQHRKFLKEWNCKKIGQLFTFRLRFCHFSRHRPHYHIIHHLRSNSKKMES